jgi:DNA-binding SARP family transcriptional activator
VRAGDAYRLDVDRDSIDVTRFQQHLARGDVEAALAEWSGTPLAGLHAPGLRAVVGGLVEQWLVALERNLEQRVETDPQAAVARLTELCANYPLREGLWATLMTALYRVGRQADALAAYQRARHHLVDELGIEPGPRLRRLEALILAHDDELAGAPPVPASPRRRGNLPRATEPLFGGDEAVPAVLAALAR